MSMREDWNGKRKTKGNVEVTIDGDGRERKQRQNCRLFSPGSWALGLFQRVWADRDWGFLYPNFMGIYRRRENAEMTDMPFLFFYYYYNYYYNPNAWIWIFFTTVKWNLNKLIIGIFTKKCIIIFIFII